MAKRNNKGQWAAGQSGNPGGRPKKKQEWLDRCRDWSGQLPEFWWSVVIDQNESTNDRLRASDLIAKYAWGETDAGNGDRVVIEGVIITNNANNGNEDKTNTVSNNSNGMPKQDVPESKEI
jgi:hypothetical protein